MRRIGVKKLFPLRKRSFGSGSRVGSGNQLNQTSVAVTSTIGRATVLIQPMLRRTIAPRPSSRDKAKPSTKIACQVNGLKNHWPGTGQVGAVYGTVSDAK